MNISKTTLNYAERRNIEIYINESGELYLTVEPKNNDCSSCRYSVENNGLFLSAVFNKELEDLPYWIENEKRLRDVISYVASFE